MACLKKSVSFIIVIIESGMIGKPFVIYVFVSFFGPDRAERSIAFLSDFELTDQ